MGKILSIFCLGAFQAAIWAGTITVTSPASGETQGTGTLSVKWSYSGLPASTTVKLIMFKNGVYEGHLATGVPISAGKWEKFESYYINGGGEPVGGPYVLKVQAEGANPPCMGESGPFFYYHTYFPFINPPESTAFSGGGSRSLALNSVYTIGWDMYRGGGPGSTARIELWRNGAKVGVIVDGAAATARNESNTYYAYDWTVGKLVGGSAPLGSGYFLRIFYHPGPGGEVAASGRPFDILEKKVMVILKYLRDNGWTIADNNLISWWVAGGAPGKATLELRQHGNLVGVITRQGGGAPGENEFWWTAGKLENGWAKAGEEYRIYVTYSTPGNSLAGLSAPFALRGLYINTPIKK